jgi:DNA modification methylase
MTSEILQGDVTEQLQTLPANSIHCAVTSPPYWGLRDYGVSGQLGLEKLHDCLGWATGIRCGECFICRMTAVFMGVHRVLRDDGVLFLNIGDSYNAGTNSSRKNSKNGAVGNWTTADETGGLRRDVPGLKPKDLCGIPWRLAFSLQAPRYEGRISSVEDRVWLAAMLDAEGCMFIHRRKAGQHAGDGYIRQTDTYSPGIEIANTSLAVIEKCQRIMGGLGSVASQSHEQNSRRKQTIYRWSLRADECRMMVRELYPHLVAKQKQARLLCGSGSNPKDAEACHLGIIQLHRGGDTTHDCAAPAEVGFKPGWYLRQDVIWAKPNPMPESVTDRCTKAHEYLFILSKSERYYWDQEAVKEQGSGLTGGACFGKVKQDGPGSRTLSSEENASIRDGTRNPRSVWTITTKPYPGAHFATFPPELPERCIKAGTSAKGCCAECGKPWVRIVNTTKTFESGSGRSGNSIAGKQDLSASATNSTPDIRLGPTVHSQTLGWKPQCSHVGEPVPCTVLDPFGGSGTTGQVAIELGRKAVLIELNPKYVKLIRERLDGTQMPLFSEAVA